MAKCAGVEPATGDEPKAERKPDPVESKVVEPKPDQGEQKPGEQKPGEQKVEKPVEPKPDATKPGPPPPPPSSSAGRSLRIGGVIVLGLGVGVEVLAVASALKASDNANSIHNQAMGTPWTTALENKQTAGQNAVLAGRVFAALGALPIVVGSVMWIVGYSKGKKHVDVAVTPTGAQVSWSCGF
jgi:hypothetical protein